MARHSPRSLNALLADIQARPQVYFPALGKGPAGRTAQAATYLNYGPQFDALAALLGGARERRRTGIQSARRSGLAGSQGIQKIRDSYTAGLKDTLGTLGGPVATDAATATPEQRAAQQLGLSGTALTGMLSGMAAQQVAGIGNQTQQLRRQFSSERSQIGDKIGALFGQAGAYNTQQFQTLAGAQRKQRAEAIEAQARLRKDLMVAGINPDTGRYDPSLDAPKEPKINEYGYSAEDWAAMSTEARRKIIKGDKNSSGGSPTRGPGSATREATTAFRKEYGKALYWAGTLKNGLTADEIIQVLIQGRPSKPKFDVVVDPETGRKKRVQVGTIPGIAPISDPMAIRAAVQTALYGGVRKPLVRRLHSAGFRLKDLGIKPWRREPVADILNIFG